MGNFLSAIQAEVPLDISFLSWDKTTLVLSGDDWSFSTQSIWRIFKDERIILGCLDGTCGEVCSILKNESVVDICFQSAEKPIDPAFHFGNGAVLEIFSTDRDEPWVLNLPSTGIYVGTGEKVT